MAAKRIDFSELPQLAGTDLGVSPAVLVDQERINGFADVTGDHQWIHVDENRAAESPFGSTIAHGYLTLSLAPALFFELLEVDGAEQVINYGLERLRFTAPVPSGSSVELAAKVAEVTAVKGGHQVAVDAEFRVPGAERPACVATFIFRYYGQGAK